MLLAPARPPLVHPLVAKVDDVRAQLAALPPGIRTDATASTRFVMGPLAKLFAAVQDVQPDARYGTVDPALGRDVQALTKQYRGAAAAIRKVDPDAGLDPSSPAAAAAIAARDRGQAALDATLGLLRETVGRRSASDSPVDGIVKVARDGAQLLVDADWALGATGSHDARDSYRMSAGRDASNAAAHLAAVHFLVAPPGDLA